MKQHLAALPIFALYATLGAALAASPCSAGGQDSASCGQAAFTIVGARVFDGEQWLPAGTQVRVQHGLVLAVGPDVGLARGGTIIDATGKTLMPEQLEAAQPARSGTGAIVTGARADLRLVEGNSGQNWSGLGAISARWKDGILVGARSSSKDL